MIINNMGVVQRGNFYEIYLPQNILICKIAMPPDGVYVQDAEVLKYVTKVLAARWGVGEPKNRKKN